MSDDSFKRNGNMAHRITRSVTHELELCSPHSKFCTHRWATDRKVQKLNHVYFFPTWHFCVCMPCHRLIRNYKDILGEKMGLCNQFLNEHDKNVKVEVTVKIARIWCVCYFFLLHFSARAFFKTQRRAVETTPPTIGVATTISTSTVEQNIKIIDIIIIEEKE